MNPAFAASPSQVTAPEHQSAIEAEFVQNVCVPLVGILFIAFLRNDFGHGHELALKNVINLIEIKRGTKVR